MDVQIEAQIVDSCSKKLLSILLPQPNQSGTMLHREGDALQSQSACARTQYLMLKQPKSGDCSSGTCQWQQ